MKFYKRDPSAALAGMAELTLQERGAYNTIIDLLYDRDGDLRDDDDIMRRVLGCHGNEWKAVKLKLLAKGKIWVEDGFWKAKRVDDVLQEAAEFSETQRKRVGKRWETRRKLAGNAPEISENHNKINGCLIPITPTPTPIVRKRESYDSRAFDEFWDAYPRRVGKKAAADKFRTAMKSGITPQQLIDGARRYAAHCHENRIGERYTKHPTTWLNQGCWDDELKPETEKTKGNGNDRLTRVLQMADRLDERAKADEKMAGGESDGASQPLLPTRSAGWN